jgi:hypothetical protein
MLIEIPDNKKDFLLDILIDSMVIYLENMELKQNRMNYAFLEILVKQIKMGENQMKPTATAAFK